MPLYILPRMEMMPLQIYICFIGLLLSLGFSCIQSCRNNMRFSGIISNRQSIVIFTPVPQYEYANHKRVKMSKTHSLCLQACHHISLLDKKNMAEKYHQMKVASQGVK